MITISNTDIDISNKDIDISYTEIDREVLQISSKYITYQVQADKTLRFV